MIETACTRLHFFFIRHTSNRNWNKRNRKKEESYGDAKTFKFSYMKNPVKELTRVFNFRYRFNKPVKEKWRMNVFI